MKEEKPFYLDFQKRIITNIIVVNTKIVNQNKLFNSEYILYVFKLISPFNSWYINKRYSEIKELYDFLISDNQNLKFPSFPPKRLLSTKESTIIERKNSFEEIFLFILGNIEILKYEKAIDFFKIKKRLLVIYINNCILVNENKLSYELVSSRNSSSSSNDCNSSTGSNKGKIINHNLKIKINNKEKENVKDIENINEKNIEKKGNINENLDINYINNNIIKKNKEENINDDGNDEKNLNINNNTNRKVLLLNGNYFKFYEEFKLASGNYTSRSQVSFFIIKELLRNLKVHSSHIFEIINDFKDYIKLKNKWKKFNEKEINSLFIGINKEELFEDYYQCILKDDKPSTKISTTSISEKSTLSSTINSISNISYTNSSNFNNSIIKNNKEIIEEDFNNKYNSYLEGLLYNIGKFEENHFGARSCLLLLNKIFEREFNPEVDIYIKLFKKLDIKFIKKMNLCKFSTINNCINQKYCFNVLNIYIGGYNEKKQIKILTELNASSSLITKFFESNYIDDTEYNIYNLE